MHAFIINGTEKNDLQSHFWGVKCYQSKIYIFLQRKKGRFFFIHQKLQLPKTHPFTFGVPEEPQVSINELIQHYAVVCRYEWMSSNEDKCTLVIRR